MCSRTIRIMPPMYSERRERSSVVLDKSSSGKNMKKHLNKVSGKGLLNINSVNKDFLFLSVILLLALFLRLHDFRQGEVLVSADEVYAFEIAAKPVYGILSGSISELVVQLFRYFNYSWGWTSLTGATVTLFILVAFHIPITEFTINISTIIVSLFSIGTFYFLCMVLTEKRLIAFFSALILAVLPVHVALSRSITVNVVYSTSLFFLTLFCFINYFKKSEDDKKKTKKYIAYGMIILGLYLGADNQFPGILPILFFSGLLFYQEKNMFRRVTKIIQTFFNKYLLLFFAVNLPLILGAIYLTQKGMFQSSYLNLFHSKPLVLGLYFSDFFGALYDDVGPVLFTIFVFSLVYNLTCIFLVKRQKKARIFVFFWFLVTAFPWLFLLQSPEVAWAQVYILQPISCLVILSALFFEDILHGILSLQKCWGRMSLLWSYTIMILCILFFTLASTSNLVYKTNYFGWQFDSTGWQFDNIYGRVEENIGIKTIGYYVREHLPIESVIFVDVEPYVGQYYLNRKIQGNFDFSDEQLYEQLLSTVTVKNGEIPLEQQEKVQFDYAFIYKDHFGILDPVLETNGYKVIAIAVDEDGKTIAKLYEIINTENFLRDPVVLEINVYDPLFNKEHGTFYDVYINYG